MIVVDTSAPIELPADGRGLRAVVAARLAAEEAAGERLFPTLNPLADGRRLIR